MTDLGDMIRRCQRGSALAWEALLRHCQDRVYSAAYYYLRDREEARDATQEVFIRVYRNLGSYRSEENSFMSWLMTIARNTCIDQVRRRASRGRAAQEYEAEGVRYSTQEEGPEAATSEGQRRRMLFDALDTLNETSREILLLKEIEGLKLEEVAQILGLPLGTVKSRASRARVELAKLLAGQPRGGPEPSGVG